MSVTTGGFTAIYVLRRNIKVCSTASLHLQALVNSGESSSLSGEVEDNSPHCHLEEDYTLLTVRSTTVNIQGEDY